jgi:hypothetical protein
VEDILFSCVAREESWEHTWVPTLYFYSFVGILEHGWCWVDLMSLDQSEDQVHSSSSFSRALIGGNPNLLGSGPSPPYTYKRHTSQCLPGQIENLRWVRSPEVWTVAGSLHYAPAPSTPVTNPTLSISVHGIVLFVVNQESRYTIKI